MKYNLLKYGPLVSCLLLFWVSKAQNFSRPEIDINDFVNKIASLQNTNREEIYENIYTLYQKPIDLNRADIEELRSIFLLTEKQIENVIKHREKYGYFLSIYELQSVENFNLETIRNILPLITVQHKNNLNGNFAASDNYLVLRVDETLQKSKGFNDNKFVGNRQRIYTRYNYSKSRDFNLGFVTEKDAGEKSLIDYFNFHVQIMNKGKLKNLIIGDFREQFGQGLIFSAAYSLGKGAESVYNTRRSNLGIKPYNSVVENNSFRGISATFQIKKVAYTFLISRSKKDASLNTSLEEFGSLLTNGYHRTTTEILNKDAIKEFDFGGNLTYKLENMQFGFSALYTIFDAKFQKQNEFYNAFEFVGKRNLTIGPNLSISWQNFNFFGEFAKSSSGGYGYITGCVASLSSKMEWALNFRNYQADFHSFYGNAFGEGSRNINEKGIYSGLKYALKPNIILSGYYDIYKFPWLKYRIDSPSAGFDYQINLNYKKSKKTNFYFAYHYESKALNSNVLNLHSAQITANFRRSLIASSEYYFNRKLRMQSKIQLNTYQLENSNTSRGFAIMHDIETKFTKTDWNFRLAYFKTDSYDSRVYAYENDVQYAVSFPAYYGNGLRAYLVCGMPLSNKFTVTFRLSDSYYFKQNTVGSGNDLLNGNQKTDVRIQFKYKFK